MKRIYVAHPLRGPDYIANIAKASAYCIKYANDLDIVPYSPLHAFGFLDARTFDPYRAMQMCFALLASCDELWLHGRWWTSEGCQAEIAYAACHGISIKFVRE